MNAYLRWSVIVCILATASAVRAQPPDQEALNKKKTQELLEKAKEEYRVFFRKPETAYQFWAAIKFEMDLGKFDLAAYHLNALLGKNPLIPLDNDKVDTELVKIEEAEGMSTFLRLKLVRRKDWSDHKPFQDQAIEDIDTLIDRVTKAVEKHLSDPDRIKKFIKNLGAPTVEERAYAFGQLDRSRERAVPYLIEALRVNYDKPLFSRLKDALIRMGPETVPVYLEVFRAANDKDAKDIELRTTLLDIVRQRDDARVVPYLWHLSASKKYPAAVRERAAAVLAALLRTDVARLPQPKEMLIKMAERYYTHLEKLPQGKPAQIWPWDGQALALKPVELTHSQAEEFYGLRYAREALDLDPGSVPAQIAFLSLLLERQYQPKLDQFFQDPLPPKMHELLTSVDASILMRTLERAMDDHQVAVILPLVHALGERGEYRAAQLKSGGEPFGVVRALYYPDRRVQFAAMIAMLRMPPSPAAPTAGERVVELARRFVGSEPSPKALVINSPPAKDAEIRKTLKDLGFIADIAHKTQEAFEKAKGAADYDLVIVHQGVSENEFPFVYGQIRKAPDLGGLPVIIIADKSREKAIRQHAGKDDHIAVIQEIQFKADDAMKDLLDQLYRKVQGVKLSDGERKAFNGASMYTLWRMARGEIQGYNLQPTVGTLVDQLRNKDNAEKAIETLGRLPGKEVQYKLAAVVVDPRQDKALRLPAAVELNRHMQNNGVQIDKKLVAQLKEMQKDAGLDPLLRTQLDVTQSLIARATPRQTGAQMFQFRPDAPAPPPMPKEKEEKKEKDDK